jgi:sugar lactone lactonase YvrE
VTAAIRGETNESMNAVTSASGSAPACCGSAGVNSAYTPVYISDYSFSRIVRADDLWGTNAQTFGSTGTGVDQFYGPHGITVDSLGRIYVADTYNCRIDRMDDITGANWVSFGTCGSGAKQFSTGGLADIATDSIGRIYVADPGNGRIDRFDDMTGTNWTSFSGVGGNVLSGAQGVAVDSAGKIYIADTGNRRLVRIDDMTGTNWTALTQSPPIGIYIYSFGSPAHVALDPTGRIEVGDGNNVIRVDDMIVATGAGFNTSNFVSQAGGIYAVPVPSPVPAVTVAPSTLTFATQNAGTSSAAQNVTLTNFGEAPLDISNVATTGDFSLTDNCGPTLIAGSSCTIGVSYAPTKTGKETGTLTISDNAFTGTQTVSLSGTGTAPIAGIDPSTLSYQPQAINTTSGVQYVYLSNTGTGPLTFAGSGIATSGDFAQTNNCGAAVAPNTACTIAVTFTPTVTGSEMGALTVTSNAPPLSVSLTGTGASTAPKVTATPESLIFPTEYVNWRSAAQTVTLKNSGTTAVSITSVAISGNFTKSGNCGTSLGAGKSCIEYVYFTPTAAGIRTGALTYTLSSGVITVYLTGTGVATPTALLTVSPTSLAFNGYVVGDNPDQIVTISNPDGVPAGIRTIAKSGSTAFTFTKTCGTTLAAGASCTVDVTFIPTVVGSYSGILYVYESAGTIHKIPLSGTAVTGN